MKFAVNEDKFDELQPWFVGDFIETIKSNLENYGISGDGLKELCSSIVWQVCTQLDGSAEFSVEGKSYKPILAFSESDDSAFYTGDTSYLHEYVHGVLDEIFEDDT